MQTFWNKPLETHSTPGISRRAEELRIIIRESSIDSLASLTSSEYKVGENGEGKFHLQLFSQPIIGSFPELTFCSPTGKEIDDFQQLLLLYYFATADGTALEDKWVSFADLPGGRMYAQAFQGYSGDEVAKFYGENLAAFRSICEQAGGEAVSAGDAAYKFQALPMISVCFVYWLGDEDFPSTCKVLFDAVATHYVPVDACAIIGSTLTRRITKKTLKKA